MSLECYVGLNGNILQMDPQPCHRVLWPSTVLAIERHGYHLTQGVWSAWVDSELKAHRQLKAIILSYREIGPSYVFLSALVESRSA
ncbi:hypothetical protein GY45DRAFT_1375715 [Cubamyces sp. BRFM 1775]|nr:hypothetical protein GY45DRAFT_1375715 [Cubamyces sp. BRFM 1775]